MIYVGRGRKFFVRIVNKVRGIQGLQRRFMLRSVLKVTL